MVFDVTLPTTALCQGSLDSVGPRRDTAATRVRSQVPGSQARPLPTGGDVRPITRWGTPVMHRELADVTTFDDDLAHPRRDMVATMRAANGVGLAANQVGVDLKVFVFDCPDADDVHVTGVVCNPVLTLPEGKDRQLEEADEGCLSLPGAFIECSRPDQAHVTRLRRARRAGRVHRHRPAGALPPARDRPPVRHRVRRPRCPSGRARSSTSSTRSSPSRYPSDWPVSPIIADDED